jgi:hypothetical protein
MQTEEADQPEYSQRFEDDEGQVFRFVKLGPSFYSRVMQLSGSRTRLLTEDQWRNGLGLQMAKGWQHIMFFKARNARYYNTTLIFRLEMQ